MKAFASSVFVCLVLGALPLMALASGQLTQPSEVRPTRHSPSSPDGMVVSATRHASEVGAKVLQDGGNAADAAVATAFALAVTWPAAGNLGGGGFLLASLDGKSVEVLDHREVAPLAATANMYQNSAGEVVPGLSTVGWKAVGVPGSVKGLADLHKRFGKLPWARLVEPAVRLARDGFIVDSGLHRSIAASAEKLSQFSSSRKIFLSFGNQRKGPPPVGSVFRQPDLAKTLQSIAQEGDKGFYRGWVAAAMEKSMADSGGLITRADLKQYRSVWRKPLAATFAGHTIHTMPPPSSGGGSLIALLKVAEELGLDQAKSHFRWSGAEIHTLVQIMKHVFRDRSEFYADPQFHPVPLDSMLSSSSFQDIAKSVRKAGSQSLAAKNVETVTSKKHAKRGASQSGRASEQTTHFSVADGRGGWVSLTTTLNSSFGSGVVLPGTGVLLNNEMDDFTSKPGHPNLYGLIQGEANAIQPKKRPLSSMTPTLISRKLPNGKSEIVAAVGSPGGPTIINQVFLMTLDLLVKKWSPAAVVAAPRFHHQWLPDRVFMEPAAFSQDVVEELLKRGHDVQIRGGTLGAAHIIALRNGLYEGGADPRLPGAVAIPQK